MAKTRPGLPDGFEIKLENPSELGDYLDEGFDQNVARAYVAKQRIAPTPPVQNEPPQYHSPQPVPDPVPQPLPQQRPHVVQSEPPQTAPRNEQVLNLADARRKTVPKTYAPKRPQRIQFNMRPETQKMFGEIVDFVQRYSLQEDAKASEILDALISVLYQSRDELAFHDVPRRGKWGTPTARAFPTALGNAFARAVAGSYAKSGSAKD